MWLIFGISAIIFTVLNIIWTFNNSNKKAKCFGFISLSLTALTVCAFYSDAAMRVAKEDWGGLMDIMPTMSKALWFCVILSIVINSISLFRDKE